MAKYCQDKVNLQFENISILEDVASYALNHGLVLFAPIELQKMFNLNFFYIKKICILKYKL